MLLGRSVGSSRDLPLLLASRFSRGSFPMEGKLSKLTFSFADASRTAKRQLPHMMSARPELSKAQPDYRRYCALFLHPVISLIRISCFNGAQEKTEKAEERIEKVVFPAPGREIH